MRSASGPAFVLRDGRDMEERPIEVSTDHQCVLGLLTRRLGDAESRDAATLAGDALEALLRAGTFDLCCLPRYLALAPTRAEREVQLPIATYGDVETRVLVWPEGSGDREHPHASGWTTFILVTGQLVAVDAAPGDGTIAGPLRPRTAVVLQPQDRLRHRLRNAESDVAVSIHISGPRS